MCVCVYTCVCVSPSDNPTLINSFTRTEQDHISVDTLRRKAYSNATLQKSSIEQPHE